MFTPDRKTSSKSNETPGSKGSSCASTHTRVSEKARAWRLDNQGVVRKVFFGKLIEEEIDANKENLQVIGDHDHA